MHIVPPAPKGLIVEKGCIYGRPLIFSSFGSRQVPVINQVSIELNQAISLKKVNKTEISLYITLNNLTFEP